MWMQGQRLECTGVDFFCNAIVNDNDNNNINDNNDNDKNDDTNYNDNNYI